MKAEDFISDFLKQFKTGKELNDFPLALIQNRVSILVEFNIRH